MKILAYIVFFVQYIFTEIKVLYRLLFSPISGKNHKERLESFYSHQAEGYDSFRKRLLHGRTEMLNAVNIKKGDVWIDMGGGTGSNIEEMHRLGKLKDFSKVYIVDLSPSLLKVAQERINKNGWNNVEVVEADATTFDPPKKANLITFSYSLTMIPDWFIALDHAKDLLAKDGSIAVVDFYVSRKYAPYNMRQHSWLTRSFWPLWFANDNVNLSSDHVHYLLNHFDKKKLIENMGPIPYFSFIKVPHYIFVGNKKN